MKNKLWFAGQNIASIFVLACFDFCLFASLMICLFIGCLFDKHVCQNVIVGFYFI